jgi:hypothetical protein
MVTGKGEIPGQPVVGPYGSQLKVLWEARIRDRDCFSQVGIDLASLTYSQLEIK